MLRLYLRIVKRSGCAGGVTITAMIDHAPLPDLPGLPDILKPDLRLVICGSNPSIRAAQTGHYYAHPGNRFYPLLFESGLTPRRLAPTEDVLLPEFRHRPDRSARAPVPPCGRRAGRGLSSGAGADDREVGALSAPLALLQRGARLSESDGHARPDRCSARKRAPSPDAASSSCRAPPASTVR